MFRTLAALFGLLLLAPAFAVGAGAETKVRIKDIVEFEGVRGNDLVGYGLVVGLNGTGDGLRNSPYTEEALATLLEQLGVNVSGESFRPKNVAGVIVTGDLPAFARTGSRVDVDVSAIGDAKSLMGGTLIMTPLKAADGQIYAVAQGPVLAGGFSAQGDAAEITQGVPTSATMPGGARVEQEIAFDFGDMDRIRLALRDPDFTTAVRIEQAINRATGGNTARMMDSGTVDVSVSAARARSPAHLMARIEGIEVAASRQARVVIDQRSGTIVLGADVKISSVAVSQGGLTVRVEEAPQATMPNPFSNAPPIVLPRTGIGIDMGEDRRLALVDEAATLADLVDGLNALGVGPRGMIDILKSIKTAGALHADLIVQ